MVNLAGERIIVTTTHFSLSSLARERAVKFLGEIAAAAPPGIEILGGDFNAEPNEAVIQQQLLVEEKFTDAWTAKHPHDEGFTFPACRPVKRIDYIFARNLDSSEQLRQVRTIGREAKEELAVGHAIALDSATGMLDDESLLWASDHFGLELELELHGPRARAQSNEL